MLLAWSDYQHSPVWDEPAHLAAGLSIWENGYFDLYTVNPPLVRAWAAVPVLLFGDYRGNEMTERQAADHARPGTRPEFNAGVRLIRVNGYRSRWLFTVARWACIPFSLLGGYFCWRWAGELYGQTAGCLAGVLWCFSPNVLAWSATICPDAAAASIGLAACYFFWRWMRKGTWGRATTAGVVLGLAELTKTTWLVLYVVWPVAWLICRILKPASLQHLRSSTSAAHLAYVLALSILVLNVGYAFEGTFSRLEQFTFLSRTGLARARGRFTIIQDADLEYDPQDYRRVITPLVEDQADVVYGSRRLKSKDAWRQLFNPFYHGVTVLNWVVRVLYGARITDEATCYKAFPTAVLRMMDLVCQRFEFCPEVTAKACRMGLKIVEVPIHYTGRARRDGKKIGLRDAVEALRTLWQWRCWQPPPSTHALDLNHEQADATRKDGSAPFANEPGCENQEPESSHSRVAKRKPCGPARK